MKTKLKLALALSLVVLMAGRIRRPPSPGRARGADDRSRTGTRSCRRRCAPTNPVLQTRSAAIVQLAVFEAVNAIVGDYEPYLGTIAAPPGARPTPRPSPPPIAPWWPCARPAPRPSTPRGPPSLAAIPDGPAKEAGIAVGEAAAAAMLALRADDGSADADVPYTPGTDPGDWQPTPPAFAPAFLPGWGQVTPFGLENGSQFRCRPPPALHTGRYAKRLQRGQGPRRRQQPFRPQDRTDVARFYAATSPGACGTRPRARSSAAQGKTLSENARIFALLAMAMADGPIAVLETQVPLQLLAARDRDPGRRHRRQPADRPGSGLAPADRHAAVPELPVGPRDRCPTPPARCSSTPSARTATPSP